MSGPLIWGPGGKAIHLGDGTIHTRHGHSVFPSHSFGMIQADYGESVVAEMRCSALTFASDGSIRVEADHNSKTIHFSISKEFVTEIVKKVLQEIELNKTGDKHE